MEWFRNLLRNRHLADSKKRILRTALLEYAIPSGNRDAILVSLRLMKTHRLHWKQEYRAAEKHHLDRLRAQSTSDRESSRLAAPSTQLVSKWMDETPEYWMSCRTIGDPNEPIASESGFYEIELGNWLRRNGW